MSVLYGITNIASPEGMSGLAQILQSNGFTVANAYSMMVFCLLYVPCAATIATIHRETRSLKWTLGSVAMQLGVAWLCSTVLYQLLQLF